MRLSGQLIDFASKIPPNIKDVKYCGVRCVNTLVDYQQCLSQGMLLTSEEIEQLAFFDKDRMDKVTKRVKKVPSIVQLVLGDDGNEKLMNLFTEEE